MERKAIQKRKRKKKRLKREKRTKLMRKKKDEPSCRGRHRRHDFFCRRLSELQARPCNQLCREKRKTEVCLCRIFLLVCCERSPAFLERTFKRFSRGNAMRCNSRPATSSWCSPILAVYPTGGGLGRARAACRQGLLFSFFSQNMLCFDTTPYLTLSLQFSCKPRFYRREHQEGSM